MRIYDIIEKKRNNKVLTKEEINYFVNGYVNKEIPDYQMSALLMAIYFNGMNDKELAYLTDSMANSGDLVDLTRINGITVDKHSTGGVGDKTTLVICPIVASLGCSVAKMSGRGLGHTGGTIDKLESIPGFKVELSQDDFFKQVNDINIAVISQSGNITPADKKMYALRDTTATIESIPLIASSIMSKKIAAGAKCILLDVKTGSGAFMKSIAESKKLASKMVNIGNNLGRNTMAIITNMDVPLGNNIGNSLEVMEAIDTLKGKGPKDFRELCIELATNMLVLATKKSYNSCKRKVTDALESGKALNKFKELVSAQGGNPLVVDNYDLFGKTDYAVEIKAKESGYIKGMDTSLIGKVSGLLGAGRATKEDTICYQAGIVVNKNSGFYDCESFSSGTIDQAYLALRIAISEFISSDNNVPLILDDAFIQYDDKRLEKVIKFFEEYANSQKERQVIVFTCHKNVSELAKKNGAHVIS